MKLTGQPNHCRALTLKELLVVVVMLVILVFFLLPFFAGRERHGPRVKCILNLKQIGLAYRVFANDRDDQFPFTVTNSFGFQNDRRAWMHYLAMSNELGNAKVLVCPRDQTRMNKLKLEQKFDDVAGVLFRQQDGVVSYFVGLDAKDGSPETILGGDYDFASNGTEQNSLLYLHRTNSVWWTDRLHTNGGNIVLGDGRVEQVDGRKFQEQLRLSPLETNRLLMPLP